MAKKPVLYSGDMDWRNVNENWALYAASVPALIVVSAVMLSLWRQSSRGRLHATFTEYRRDLRRFEAAKKKQAIAERRIQRLKRRADKVKPRLLQRTIDAAEDATALVRILENQVHVSANHVRKVILKEYPPTQHDKLRARYLPGDVADGRPFSF